MTIDQSIHLWLNVATALALVGAAFYVSLWRYME